MGNSHGSSAPQSAGSGVAPEAVAANTDASRQLLRKGKHLCDQRTQSGLQEGIAILRQALALDPDCAMAYAAIAEAFVLLSLRGYAAPSEGFLRARAAAQRALAIDTGLAEAWGAEGWVRLCFDYDWAGAEAAFAQAATQKRFHPRTLKGSALLRFVQGRNDEALTLMQEAWRADAISPWLGAHLAFCYYLARQFARAVEQAEQIRTYDGSNYLLYRTFGLSYLLLGNSFQAIGCLKSAVDLAEGNAIETGYLGYAYGKCGNAESARECLDRLQADTARQNVPAFSLAMVNLGLQRMDQTFAWLQKACERRSPLVLMLRADPLFDPLREDSRFSSLLDRVGFPRENPDPKMSPLCGIRQ
jgi:tetratricopeptide (TPR) repeat protein